ncbi:MAG: SDR family oxidoreductase [Proteobacteria bacterium]|nr:SDR family oxidoreductase [Pseudomonadota bacterium]
MTSLTDRTAFVTGAAQGLGAAIARALYSEGCRVALTDISPAVHDTARALDPGGTKVRALQLDVRDRDAFASCFADAVATFGGVDIMVNNAARTVARSLWDITPAEWDDVLAVNLRGVFFGCQIAGRHMRDRRRGRIINLSSIAGQQGSLVNGAHYSASKAGILVLTKIFAQELAPYGVTVNTLAPAAIRTPALAASPPDKIEEIRRTMPVGRLGEPEDVAAAAVYLASDAAGFVTGATLDLNGGRFMR